MTVGHDEDLGLVAVLQLQTRRLQRGGVLAAGDKDCLDAGTRELGADHAADRAGADR